MTSRLVSATCEKRVNEITFKLTPAWRIDARCDLLMNTPELGKKTYINAETGVAEKVEDMTEAAGRAVR
jgi:hypothetical protein